MDNSSTGIPGDLYKIAVYLINHFDMIDTNEANRHEEWPTVLVFLPGIHEIVRMETALKDHWGTVLVKTSISLLNHMKFKNFLFKI